MAIKTITAELIATVRTSFSNNQPMVVENFADLITANASISSSCSFVCDNIRVRISPVTVNMVASTVNLVNYKAGPSPELASTALLDIVIPTTISIDFSKLNIPFVDGEDYVFELTEGFFKDVGGNQSPSKAIANLLSFRRNEQGISTQPVVFTASTLVTRIKQLAANINDAMDFTTSITYSPGGLGALLQANFYQYFIDSRVKITGYTANLFTTATSNVLGGILKEETANISSSVSTTVTGDRIRFGEKVLQSNATMNTFAIKTTDIILGNTGFGTMIIDAVKTTVTGSNMDAVSTTVTNPIAEFDANINITPVAELETVTDLTMIFNTNLNSTSYNGSPLTNNTTISVPVDWRTAFTSYSGVSIDWGDGNTTNIIQGGSYSHTYSSHGEYRVRVIANKQLKGFGMTGPGANFGNKIKEFRCWGVNTFTNVNQTDFIFQQLFAYIPYTGFQVPTYMATDASRNADLRVESMFFNCLANPTNMQYWDWTRYRRVGALGAFGGTFQNMTNMNIDTTGWDLSKTSYDFGTAFRNNRQYNQPMGNFIPGILYNGSGYTHIRLEQTNISEVNYNKTLVDWANAATGYTYSNWGNHIVFIPSDVSETTTTYGSGTYQTGATARQFLENSRGWTFTSRTRFQAF